MDDSLWSVRRVAAALMLSDRMVWKLEASGRMPRPIRIGRSVRWRSEEIRTWIDLGCPARDVFEAQRGQAVPA